MSLYLSTFWAYSFLFDPIFYPSFYIFNNVPIYLVSIYLIYLGVLLAILLEDELSLQPLVLILSPPPVLSSLSLVLRHVRYLKENLSQFRIVKDIKKEIIHWSFVQTVSYFEKIGNIIFVYLPEIFKSNVQSQFLVL